MCFSLFLTTYHILPLPFSVSGNQTFEQLISIFSFLLHPLFVHIIFLPHFTLSSFKSFFDRTSPLLFSFAGLKQSNQLHSFTRIFFKKKTSPGRRAQTAFFKLHVRYSFLIFRSKTTLLQSICIISATLYLHRCFQPS